MSYTIVVDEQERARRYENRLNVLVRHCKIGKVTRKAPVPTPSTWPSPAFWAPLESEWWHNQPRLPDRMSPGTGDYWRLQPISTC